MAVGQAGDRDAAHGDRDREAAAGDAPSEAAAAGERVPVLADGVKLLGEYEDSGLEEPPSIAQRPDGQLIQLPKLLYVVAENLDGTKTYEQAAEAVSLGSGTEVGAGDVRLLVDEKLRPLGLLAGSEPSAAVERPDPLLALKLKTAVVPEGVTKALTTMFLPLFFGPVMLAVVGTLVALDVWLFSTHGFAQSFRHLIHRPLVALLLFGLAVVGTAFHEIGHATACRYGGGKPGGMGVGIYIIWPAFYTDVNDAHRLGRWARIRTDIGGPYFNVIFALGAYGAYFLTGFEPFLLLVVVEHLQMFQQFLPFLRLDGYYVISDWTGVPDLFARIGPIMRSLIPGREPDPRVTELKPWVRAVVTIWVLATIPVILLIYALMIVHIPRLISTGLASFDEHASAFTLASSRGDFTHAALSVLQIGFLVLPTIGAVFVLTRTVKRLGTLGWRATDGRPALRGSLVALLAAGAVFAALALLPDQNYRPIGPDERGTLGDATATLARTTTQAAEPVASPSPMPSPSASPGLTPEPGPRTPRPPVVMTPVPRASATPVASPAPPAP